MKSYDLKGFRTANYLNQSDVAKFLGCTKSFISRVEKGKEKLPERHYRLLLNNDMGWDTAPLLEEIEINVMEEDAPSQVTPQPSPNDGLADMQMKIIQSQQETIERLSKVIERLTSQAKGASEDTARTA